MLGESGTPSTARTAYPPHQCAKGELRALNRTPRRPALHRVRRASTRGGQGARASCTTRPRHVLHPCPRPRPHPPRPCQRGAWTACGTFRWPHVRLRWSRAMDADALIQALGYHEAPGFLDAPRWREAPGHAHVFRHTDAACRGPKIRGRFRGIYTLGLTRNAQRRPSTPVVYVCEAPDAMAAAEIHRLTWLQSAAPF